MPLLASASFDGGIGNSATATSIESFEAVVANQHIRRRDAMDLKANDFSKKIILSLMTGFCLGRVHRGSEAADSLVQCWWNHTTIPFPRVDRK